MSKRVLASILPLLAGCLPFPQSVGGDESDSSSADGEGGVVESTTTAPDGLDGTGVDPSATDGTTSAAEDSEGATTGTGSIEMSSTGPDAPTGGSDPTTTGTAHDGCEDMLEKISCDALADGPSIFNAIGLGCEGDPLQTIPIGTWTFPPALDPESWGIATQYGTHVNGVGDPTFGPREGESFLVLSTGTGVDPDVDGLLTIGSLTAASNTNSDNSAAPAPIAWPVLVNDLVWFQVEMEVPPGVTGFSIDMAYFSQEFPEWVGTKFNDALVLWAHSPSGSFNACMTTAGEPCTVTSLWPSAYSLFSEELTETGFEGTGATGWQTVRAPAVAGETLGLTVALFDTGDTSVTTLVLLDAFQWECDGCDGTPGNECGFEP